MMFFNLLTFLLLALSVSFMWSFSDIFAPIRNIVAKIPYIRRPLLCPECSSFWVGAVVSLIYNPLLQIAGHFSYPLCGLVTHLLASFVYKLYYKL